MSINQSEPNNHKNNMIILIVVLIIVVAVALAISGYYLYKIGTKEETEAIPTISKTDTPNTNVPSKTASSSAVTSSTTQTYYNSRFGYSVKEPAGFSKFESQNGDGASFSQTAPAVGIGVYGANNIENLTATQYLNKELSTLQMETPDAKEISWGNINMDGCAGEKRVWQYSPATGGGQDIEVMAICTKESYVYGIYMTLSANDYDKYSPVFDQILASFKFGK